MRRFQKEHGRDRLCATYWAAPHTRSLYRSPGTPIGKSIDYLDFATIELPGPAYRPEQVSRSADIRSSTVPTPGLNLTRHQLDTVHIHPDSISRTLTKAALPAKMRIAGVWGFSWTAVQVGAIIAFQATPEMRAQLDRPSLSDTGRTTQHERVGRIQKVCRRVPRNGQIHAVPGKQSNLGRLGSEMGSAR